LGSPIGTLYSGEEEAHFSKLGDRARRRPKGNGSLEGCK
jgi:hypothetical protein